MMTLFAQQRNTSVVPSAYYTNGSYSNSMTSTGTEAFASIVSGSGEYAVAGLSRISIDSSAWSYQQTMLSAGGMVNFYPWFLKAQFGFVNGKYDHKRFVYSYEDNITILNASAMLNWDLFYFSAHGTRISVQGYKDLSSVQAGLKIDWLCSDNIEFSLDPLFTSVTDGRSLFSTTLSGVVSPIRSVTITAAVTAGERVYYYDPDIMAIFNQNETQSSALSGKIEYAFWGPFTAIGSYETTRFTGYTIRYATLGLKGSIPF